MGWRRGRACTSAGDRSGDILRPRLEEELGDPRWRGRPRRSKPASAATKIRNGKSAISADRATWLAIAQPSSSLRWPRASARTAPACRKKVTIPSPARSPEIASGRVSRCGNAVAERRPRHEERGSGFPMRRRALTGRPASPRRTIDPHHRLLVGHRPSRGARHEDARLARLRRRAASRTMCARLAARGSRRSGSTMPTSEIADGGRAACSPRPAGTLDALFNNGGMPRPGRSRICRPILSAPSSRPISSAGTT